ncbi:hypothetical protein [Burkholderia glumae]|uniref:hypothetical protein n=1 Tax=Burkholderia glumae TaxID=337 RepID=UPI00215093D7|nr:hypothetical protein [Burkholderia glumae]UVS95472.1 hypothetical protein EFP19_06625 [Burkholderia glumae]
MNDRPPLDVVALAEPGAAARAASSAVWLDAAELHALRLAAQGVPAPGQAAAVTRLHDALARVDGARPVIVLDDPVLRDTRAFDAMRRRSRPHSAPTAARSSRPASWCSAIRSRTPQTSAEPRRQARSTR